MCCLNHYASVCRGGKPCKRQNKRTKDIKPLEADNENDSSASDDYLYSLTNPSLSYRKETPKTKVTVASGVSKGGQEGPWPPQKFFWPLHWPPHFLKGVLLTFTTH